MNKKIWVSGWLLSFFVFFGSLLLLGLFAVLANDRVLGLDFNMIGIFISLVVLAYLQFLIVSMVLNLTTLAKIWGVIQDQYTPVSVGKAIGFLFIPFFSLYWIFRVWGGFPDDYNKFAERHQLNVPKLSGGTFILYPITIILTAIFIFPLVIMPFIFAAVISESADAVNNLKEAFRVKNESLKVGTPSTTPVYTQRRGFNRLILAGVAFSLLTFFSLIIFAVLASRNSKVFPTLEEVPPTVSTFNLVDKPYGRGSFLGTSKSFSGAKYHTSDSSKPKEIIYNFESYLIQGDAIRAMERNRYCQNKTSERGGQLKDAKGVEIGNFFTCDSRLWVRNNKQIFSVLPAFDYDIKGGKVSAPTFAEILEFAKNLPLNLQVDLSIIGGSSTASNSKESSNSTGPQQTYPVDKSADFTMTAEEFSREADDSDKWKAGLAKYKGKVVEISGRAYLFQPFDGKELFFRTVNSPLELELEASQDVKLSGLKEDERIKLKCDVAGDYRAELKNCIVTERRPAVTAEEAPEATFTAKEYYDQVENSKLSYETRKSNREKYFGKVLEFSGRVKRIGSDAHFLSVSDNNWLTCYPDDEDKALFEALADGQEAKFRGVDDGIALKHCIVAK